MEDKDIHMLVEAPQKRRLIVKKVTDNTGSPVRSELPRFPSFVEPTSGSNRVKRKPVVNLIGKEGSVLVLTEFDVESFVTNFNMPQYRSGADACSSACNDISPVACNDPEK